MDDRSIYRAECVERNAFTEIYTQYEPLVISMAERFYAIALREGLDIDSCSYDDFRQEAVIALYSAFRGYDTDISGVTFGLYAKICIRNRLISELRKCKARPINDDVYSDVHDSPESRFIEHEDYRYLLSVIDRMLSEYEKSVLALYIDGKSYKEIAERLGKTEKSVDGAVYRIKAKLKEYV